MSEFTPDWTDNVVEIPSPPGLPELFHEFDEESILAIRAALGAKRPLLVRGEPGVGKTQLAVAAAQKLRRPLVTKVVDSRTESRELLWDYDAVLRLADAQIAAALRNNNESTDDDRSSDKNLFSEFEQIRKQLSVDNYVSPGPLWWAFDWNNARDQALKCGAVLPPFVDNENSSQKKGENKVNPDNGFVVLIDEVDKAETDVPNGLLEALGSGQFQPQGMTEPVTVSGPTPLVIITTNEERVLPDAFLRRCLILALKLPKADDDLEQYLVHRAKIHFPKSKKSDVEVFKLAAQLLINDRQAAINQNATAIPGQAEFLDLIRAIRDLYPNETELQKEELYNVARYTFKKYEDHIR